MFTLDSDTVTIVNILGKEPLSNKNIKDNI